MKTRTLHAWYFGMMIGFAFVACTGSAFAFGKKAASSESTAAVAPPEASKDSVWVVRPDGSRNCVKDSGEKVEVAASQLTTNNIAALETKKTGDGKMHPMVCGAATGRQNAFRINVADQARALVLGFQLATKENAPALFTVR
jgi:hypothetical protein